MFHKNKSLIVLILAIASFSQIHTMNFGKENFGKEVDKKSLFIPSRLGTISLHHDESGFKVVKNATQIIPVQSAYMDKELRGISNDKLKKMIKMGVYLAVNQSCDGEEYLLKLKGRLKGGGAWGATIGFFAGKMAVSVVGHGAIALVSAGVGIFCPPVGVAVGIALESALAVPIESASVVVGCGTAIGLAVATGPI